MASEQLVRELEKAEGQVELIDSNGNRIGTITRPPNAEDIRIAKERLAVDGIWHTAAEAIKHLESLEAL